MWKLRLEEFWERRLVARVVDGDREAGEQLVRKHYASIYGFMMSLTQNREVSEELVQSTFLSGWQSLPSFRHESTLRTWLHQIAYRQYLGWRRKQAILGEQDPAELISYETGLVDGVWIQQSIAAMPHSLAEPFVLYYVQQLSVNEIAQVLDLKRGTVLSRLYSARQLMRKLMMGHEQPSTLADEREQEDPDPPGPLYEMSKAPL